VKLYLVRHGRSAGNLPGRMTGWSDHPLTRLGVAQARRVAARVAPLGPMPVYTSDLPRALQTAELIAARWRPGEAGGPRPDRRLREIDLGDFEGRTWAEFVADAGLADAFARDPLGTALPGGESMNAVRDRVIAAYAEIVGGDDAVACLVAHDGPLRTILNDVLGVPPERHWALSTSHGGLSLIETDGAWTSVRFVNDTSHLRGLASDDRASPLEAPARVVELAGEARAGGAAEQAL
jgi:broad specificity phosphatase PhoE